MSKISPQVFRFMEVLEYLKDMRNSNRFIMMKSLIQKSSLLPLFFTISNCVDGSRSWDFRFYLQSKLVLIFFSKEHGKLPKIFYLKFSNCINLQAWSKTSSNHCVPVYPNTESNGRTGALVCLFTAFLSAH